ncbi:MAG TPA: NADH-quinone oxidoreductase subunit N [Acidimicrobiia bacterium]|nr:NADH-quinone oxidoreductase subunit N [Acidimicrobiia bacterium]
MDAGGISVTVRLGQGEIPVDQIPVDQIPVEGQPTQTIPTPDLEFAGIGPEVVVSTTALVIVGLLALSQRWPRLRSATFWVSIVGLAVAGVLLAGAWSDVMTFGSYQTLRGMVAVDGFALFNKFLVLVATFLGLLIAQGFLRRENLDAGAYHALILLSAAGMLMMASANDLIVIFLALEVLSIALYVLAAFHRDRLESQEAGIKYFVLGAFSSAIFLYGVAWVYGATGTTSLTGIAQFLSNFTLVENQGLLVGLALLLVGFGFKVSAVPFHMWTPDVYEGAPTPVTAFMSAGTKVASFAALLRVLQTGLETQRLDWEPLVFGLAVLTLVVGSVLAIVQTNVKRMLAYSSISHAGFVLIGVQAGTDDGVAAALAYLFAYTFIVVGTFSVVTVLAHRGDVGHDLSDYRGLSRRQPVVAALLAFLLFAQAGIPLTSGFVAKLAVFRAAVNDEQYALVIVAVLVAVVAAFVYIRLLVVTYLEDTDSDGTAGRVHVDGGARLALAICAAFTLAIGVAPNALLDIADRANFLF